MGLLDRGRLAEDLLAPGHHGVGAEDPAARLQLSHGHRLDPGIVERDIERAEIFALGQLLDLGGDDLEGNSHLREQFTSARRGAGQDDFGTGHAMTFSREPLSKRRKKSMAALPLGEIAASSNREGLSAKA